MSRFKGRLWPVTTVVIILGMLVLPVFPQDEPPPNTEDTSEALDKIAGMAKRAEQGHAPSQFNLGVMYSQGQGVSQDYKEAVRWYLAAAEQGYESAQYGLGDMYYDGQGVSQDYKEALRWYLAAAEQGYSSAQVALGVMYERGQGVPQDYIQAHMWFNLAAASGGDKDRETAAKNRDLLARIMTSEQIAEAQRLAREWKPVSPQ